MDLQKSFHLRNLPYYQIVLILFVTSCVYFQTIHFDFINYDDDGYIYQNQNVISGISTKGVVKAFSGIYKANWIPLTLVSYMMDSTIFGASPAGYHVTNMLFHIFNSLLVFFFLKISTGRPWPAFVVAMLFAVHPLHVESVAWISERKDVLSTFFGLLALIMYIRYAAQKDFKKYLMVFFLLLCSLMSKPMLVTMPLLFLLLDFWPLQRLASVNIVKNTRRFWALVLEKLPFFILSLIFCVIAILGQKLGGALGAATEFPFSIRLANAIVSYTAYIYKTIYPENLAVIYPYPSHISLLRLMISVLILTVITCAAIFRHKQNPELLVGWFWFLITLLPVIGLIQVGTQAMADRYTYVPLIGLFVSGVWGIHALSMKFRINGGIAAFAATAVIFTFSIMAMNQISIWNDSETIFFHTLSVTRNNWAAHLNYGEALMEKGRVNAAISQYQQALAINPGFELAYLNLGVAAGKKGQTDIAIHYYQKALAIKQNLPVAWLNLGNAYFRKGMPDKALSYYETALSFQSDSAEAYCGIGAVMAGKGDLNRAMQAFQQALVVDPGSISAKNAIMRIEEKIKKTRQ